MTNDYEYWQQALAGNFLPIHEDDPRSGFYRKRVSKAGGYLPVAIWRDANNTLVGLLEGRETNPVDLWTYCADKPVTEEQYRAHIATGKWHDEDDSVTASLSPPPAGHNNPPDDPAEIIKGAIDAAMAGVDAYVDVRDDTTAAKAQSLRSRLLELSGDADKARENLVRPHLDAQNAFNAVWMPLVKSSKAAADKIKAAISAHETRKHNAELARQAAERKRLAEEQAKHAPIGAPEPPPEPAPAPVAAPIKGAYGRGASVKVIKVATVVNQDMAYENLKTQPELVAVIQKLAQKAVDNGFTVPGVTIEEQRKVV